MKNEAVQALTLMAAPTIASQRIILIYNLADSVNAVIAIWIFRRVRIVQNPNM